MKTQTTENPAPQLVDLERERADDDSWVASFESEVKAVAQAYSDIPRPAKPVAPPPPKQSRLQVPLVVAGVCGSVMIAGWFAWQTWTVTPAASAAPAPVTTVAPSGTADFKSVPDGASITIDGTLRGVTPLRVSLAPGTYNVQITSGSTSRTLPITVEASSVVSQYVELAPPTVTMGGRLEIGSDPPGAQVALDGASKGVTPLVLNDVIPGQHRITVSAGDNTVSRTVTVTRGATVALVISTAPVTANGAGGWLTIQAPVDMDILEDGRVLGSTRMERLMLPVGSHRLEFANAALEFTTARTVQVAAGKTASVAISLPSGKLAVNAVPWADVFMDGASLGATPLGELDVPIGTHELVFRHPQLGERRQTVTVKAQTPTRIGVDLRK